MSDNKPDIRIYTLNSYVRPIIKEDKTRNWVMNGNKNQFYYDIIDAYTGSPTNAAIINSYTDLIYGRGLIKTAGSTADWVKLKQVLTAKNLKRAISDKVMFNEFALQVIETKGKDLHSITHMPKYRVIPAVENEEGEIETYWYSRDWRYHQRKENKPIEYDAFNGQGQKDSVYVVKPYTPGREYFADPDYIAAMPYATMEKEIANLYVNSIENGLSAGYIINVPGGITWTDEQKADFDRDIKAQLTRSPNASKYVLSYNGSEEEVKITPIPVNDSVHKQWEYLTKEARQQLLTGHRVTSPMLFGVKDNTGLGNNADELEKSREALMEDVIYPKRQQILEPIYDILELYGINLKLEFQNLRTAEPKTQVALSAEPTPNVDLLLSKGEDLTDDWVIVDDRRCDEITLREKDLNTVFEFASVPKTANKNSKQDTSLFKIRYVYAGSGSGERDFCNRVVNSNKSFRAEDLDGNFNYNEDFAPTGKNSYNIFKYKGGVNCKHWWQRLILVKKDNEQISVNKARKMILELEPEDRDEARWEDNPKEVAQVASPFNNWWSLKPNYRGVGLNGITQE